MRTLSNVWLGISYCLLKMVRLMNPLALAVVRVANFIVLFVINIEKTSQHFTIENNDRRKTGLPQPPIHW